MALVANERGLKVQFKFLLPIIVKGFTFIHHFSKNSSQGAS